MNVFFSYLFLRRIIFILLTYRLAIYTQKQQSWKLSNKVNLCKNFVKFHLFRVIVSGLKLQKTNLDTLDVNAEWYQLEEIASSKNMIKSI